MPHFVEPMNASMRHRQAVVAIATSPNAAYPATAPFHPPAAYPELVSHSHLVEIDTTNQVYAAVRESFRQLDLDASSYGTAHWNPLGGLIRPGQRVVIKPNWVSHCCEHDPSWLQIITHGSVIRAVCDYVQTALKGAGTITIADGPMLNSDFAAITSKTGIDEVCKHYDRPGMVPVEVLDLREQLFETRGQVVFRRIALPGDPRGGVVVDLGRDSALFAFAGEGRYYGADYDRQEVNRHHHHDVHEYRLSATVMNADVVIDVPKLKTHHKVGVTMALKGIVGVNSGRNWLPHRTQGTPRNGGDQFAESNWRRRVEAGLIESFERLSLRFPRVVPPIYRVAKSAGKYAFGKTGEVVRGGGWHGNDTLWRMVHDINRAMLYGDASGTLHRSPTKRRFVVIDGIVAGQGLGPVSATPIDCGVIIAGENAAAVDVVGAELMGFDYRNIPMLANAFKDHALPLAEFAAESITTTSNVPELCGGLDSIRRSMPFEFAAPLGWIDFVERRSSAHPPGI